MSRFVPDSKLKNKSHTTPAFSPGAAAQPGAQGDAGLRLGVFPLVRPPAPLSSGVGQAHRETL